MKRLMILNGPNLNLLGVREPHIYGTTTLAQIKENCEKVAAQLGLALSFHQSNHEGALVDLIQSARESADAIIINPAGHSFTSIAILYPIKTFPRPTTPFTTALWAPAEESFAAAGNGPGLSSMYISMPDHAGRHIAAPRTFNKGGQPINEYPLENCIVPGICIDLRHIAARAEITPADLEAAVKKSGAKVPKGGTVLLCTGHHARTFPRKGYPTENSGVNCPPTQWRANQGVAHFAD